MRPRTFHASSGSSAFSTRAVPSCGRSSVASTRRSVVLPAPFDPKTPSVWPSPTVTVTPSSASRSPYLRVTPASSITLERRRGVLQRRLDDGPGLLDPVRRPGKVDDQRPPADAGDAAREDAERRVVARLRPDRLGEAGRVAVDHVERR